MMTAEVEVERSDVQLKRLGFVRGLAINAAVLVTALYGYAKENSGPLKSTVGKVENAVTAVVGPVFERFKGVPGDFLVFLDRKVDEASLKFEECAPPTAKGVAIKAQAIAKEASRLLQELVEEAKAEGPIAAISHAGRISKDVAVSGLAVAWYKANQFPALHGVLEIAVPTATHWSEKYNSLVKDLAGKGYTVFCYAPLVPVEEMEKAYKQVEAAANKKTDASSSSASDSEKEE
ncbi:REF/SRPP-like protein At1g67360 [Salvia miltiorrhiza]|uniref:REF/SRPP-like protein At1g67360 n=1 Tax=Salvia miltiorrhiza TaxID=226208 RepID=UPI0025AC9911|nr:REF/SRPP-like protein At1g67360 [Salvia miltiorrhiza]